MTLITNHVFRGQGTDPNRCAVMVQTMSTESGWKACGHPVEDHKDRSVRVRPEDQPLPVQGEAWVAPHAISRVRAHRSWPDDVVDGVTKDIQERVRIGVQRYGKPLQTFNGRNALRDMYEELLDTLNYGEQDILEKRETVDPAFLEMFDNVVEFTLWVKRELVRREDSDAQSQ